MITRMRQSAVRTLMLGAMAALVSTSVMAKSHKEYKAVGDCSIDVFNKENVHFDPNKIGNYEAADADGIIRLVNGRIVLKKISVPQYQRKGENSRYFGIERRPLGQERFVLRASKRIGYQPALDSQGRTQIPCRR